MPAIFFASSKPPTRATFICRIDAALSSSTRWNSYLVVRRSPVETGIEVARATSAIAASCPGGTGSSNQSGSYFSRRLARRIAEDGTIWPWVPKSRSALLPTASRILRQNSSQRSITPSESWCPE
ncbi:hypothetical protein D9M72_549060 [compost metagenome]